VLFDLPARRLLGKAGRGITINWGHSVFVAGNNVYNFLLVMNQLHGLLSNYRHMPFIV